MQSLRGNIIATAVGQLVVIIAAFLINKILSVQLSVEDYTYYGIANKFASVIAFVVLFGLGITLPRYIARFRAQKLLAHEKGFLLASLSIIGVVSVLIAVVVMLFNSTIALLIFGDSGKIDLVLAMLVFAFGIAYSNATFAYLRGVDKFQASNILQVSTQVVSLIIVVAIGASVVDQFMARGILVAIISLVVLGAYYKTFYRKVSVRWSEYAHQWKEAMIFSAPRVPGEVALFSLSALPLVIINARFSTDIAAHFVVAVTLVTMVTPLFQFVGFALLPFVSQAAVKNKLREANEKIVQLRILYIIAGLLAAGAVAVFTEFVIRLIFADTYTSAAMIVRVIIWSIIPNSLYLLLRNPIDAVSRFPYNTINLGICLLILVGGSLMVTNPIAIAVVFIVGYGVLGVLSELTWHRRVTKHEA